MLTEARLAQAAAARGLCFTVENQLTVRQSQLRVP